ncbi:MAG: membrane protein insertion efficiency factor YidD [Acidobacteriota bacterium]
MRLLRVYQLVVSPWLPAACRFLPTCSEYSRQAFERYPARRAAWLTLRRLARCHPFAGGGHDPLE